MEPISPRTALELPEDVLRIIFEYAAFEDRHFAARTLLPVCKTVNLWVEKIAYGVIIIRTGYRASCLAQTLGAKPHLRSYVRALAIPGSPAPTNPHLPTHVAKLSFPSTSLLFIRRILQLCTSIEALYWNWQGNAPADSIYGSLNDIRSSLESLPLKILYLELSPLLGWNHSNALAFNESVTHLGILDSSVVFASMANDSDKKLLAPGRWEGLTHLALQASHKAILFRRPTGVRSLYRMPLDMAENLKACVIYAPEIDKEEEKSYRVRRGVNEDGEVEDDRIVVVEQRIGLENWMTTVEEWERSGMFAAERVVARRKMHCKE